MAAANYKLIYPLLKNFIVILFFLVLVTGLMRWLNIESFVPFQNFYQQFLEAQKQANSYNNWVGYAYRTANSSSTANVLNDFKRRVFMDSCTFKDTWGSSQAPNGAENATIANVSYKSFIQCLKSGNRACYAKIDDARQRFMTPGCQLRNPIDTSETITVAFK